MARRNAVARAVLYWLYDEDDNYPLVEDFLTLPASQVGNEQVGNDELVRTVRWLDDRGLIDGLRIDQVPYPLKLRLTADGRNVVVEQDGWVQPEAASAAPPSKPPLALIAQAFLRWLYHHNREQPTPSGFLNDPLSKIGDHQVNQAEMVEAVELLDAKHLVRGPKAWGESIPIRISLTDAGRICVTEQDADPTSTGPVRTWDDVARGVSMIDKSINVEGNGNWIIAHSDDASQAQEADPHQQPEFSVALGRRIPDHGYEVSVIMHGGPQQLDVSIAVAVLEPQEGVSATVTNNSARRMVRDFPRSAKLQLTPDSWATAIWVDVIVTCIDVDNPARNWDLHRALMIPQPARVTRANIRR
jgi:hypothetical protein